MGIIRVFKTGLITGIRNKKRTISMIILFTILLSIVLYQISRVDSYNTDSLIYTRGVILSPTHNLSAKDAYQKIDSIYSSVDIYTSAVFVVYYVNIVPGQVAVISVKPFRELSGGFDWRWVVDEIKPTKIVKGRHIESVGEAIINDYYRLSVSSGGIIFSHERIGVGDVITLRGNGKFVKLKVVGLFNTTKVGFRDLAGDVSSLIVVSWKDFEKIVLDIFGEPISSVDNADFVYVKRVIFLAKGNLLSGEVSKNLRELKNSLAEIVANSKDFKVSAFENIDPSRFKTDLTWAITSIAISIILSFMYAFILVKFKGKDIATLRAIGWSKKDVIFFTFGEFFLIISLSYILSIVAINFYVILLNITLYIPILVYFETLFIAMLSILFGYIIVSRRITKIPPIRAFREV